MSILWKLLLGLGIALPISAYVLGSLVALGRRARAAHRRS